MQISEGELLRRMRALSGLNQTQLAKKLNVDKSVISRVEKGTIAVTLSRAMEWANKTGNQDMLIAFIAGSQTMADIVASTPGILSFINLLIYLGG